LDLHLSEILNAKSFFKKRLQSNPDKALEALHEYYVEVAELIGAEVPLTAEQVLLTSYRMQTLLQKHGEAQESGTEMILFGSFVNGKAVAKTSDLDYAVTTARMEEILSAENIKPLLKEFDFSEAQPHLVLHRNIHELGFLNPLIIIITENQISLRIYEELNTQDLHGRRILFDEYYF
jgi:predicted nucleotidyltransferase